MIDENFGANFIVSDFEVLKHRLRQIMPKEKKYLLSRSRGLS